MHPAISMLWLSPAPARKLLSIAIRKLRLLPYRVRVELFMEKRQHYAYCLLKSAELASKLGIPKISALEFGVAGGNGLVNLEYHAAKVTKLTGVEIEIYGFDGGEGLPKPQDYRDLPYHWKEGFFKMDKEALLARLEHSKVIFGDVAETAKTFVEHYQPAPIGCVFHDLDFYSSTKDSMVVLDCAPEFRLPRIFNYFDDVIGTEITLYNPFTGELCAINDYNAEHLHQKLAAPMHLRKYVTHTWHHQLFIHHDFVHPRYNDFVSQENQQLPMS